MRSPLQLEPIQPHPLLHAGQDKRLCICLPVQGQTALKKTCIMQTFFANSASNPRCRICSPKAEKAGHLARLFRLYLLNTLLRRTFSSHLRHACFHAHLRVTHRPMHCKDRRPFLVPDRTIIHIARLGLAPRRLLCAARADPRFSKVRIQFCAVKLPEP